MVATHQAALLPLCLGLALAPSVASARSAVRPSGLPGCPALHREQSAPARDPQVHVFGYELLRAGRVDDAVAFFQLHVVPPRSRAMRATGRTSI
ncbi:MAG TPA: hypothetical protein VI159_04965 [Gemmatimonadales bacterium]